MKQPKPIYQYNYPNTIYSDNIPPVPTETIATSGCGIVASVMMLSAFGIRTTVEELAKEAMANRFRVSSGTAWALFPYLAKKYGLQLVQTDDLEKVKKALQEGALVICSMGSGTFTKSGHFILAYDYANGKIYVNDPVSSKRTGQGYDPALIHKEHKEYFIFSLGSEVKNLLHRAVSHISAKIPGGLDIHGWSGTDYTWKAKWVDTLLMKIAKAWK